MEFLRHLAALIPPPRVHVTRYHGVFAPHHRHRAAVARLVAADPSGPARRPAHAPASEPRRRLDWATLMKRVFVLDVLVCHACGGPLRILAVLSEGEATRAILDHLGLPITAPVRRAHGPPGGLVVGSTWGN